MIAEALRNGSVNMNMASTSDSKMSLEFKDEKEEAAMENGPLKPSTAAAAASTNGELSHEDEKSSSAFTPVKDEEEEDFLHLSSEDEDKLVINENCGDKKETLRHDPAEVVGVVEGGGGPPKELTRECPPKSPLKRPAEDVDTPESKKPRVLEDAAAAVAAETAAPESLLKLDESISMAKKDLQGIDILLLQKEEEWNALLRLRSKKEEKYCRLERKRQLLKANFGDKKEDDQGLDEEDENVVFLPQGVYSSLGTSQFPLIMMKHMLGENYLHQVVASHKSPHLKDGHSSNGPVSSQRNISVIDIHTNGSKGSGGSESTQISISPETHSKLGRQLHSTMSMKPILPKPMNCIGGIMNPGGTPPPPYASTGFGPHGPTVSVHQLIAAHRKDNPNIPLIRGAKRGAWRHRYEGEKRSSSREPDRPSSVSSSNSETEVRINPSSMNSKGGSMLNNTNNNNNNNNLLTMNDPSVSYKDVLLQFAQLTQTEKQPGSPQISIIPVSAGDSSRKLEHTPDSTSVSRELSVPSQSQNLEGSSALAKLLLESGAGNHHGNASKSSPLDISSYSASPHCLTLSALLSGGTTTTVKDKQGPAPQPQVDNRLRPNKPAEEGGNSNPKCQGCHKNRAQFVCAGCSNQWYCSRSCQVTAWEKHSEHCSS